MDSSIFRGTVFIVVVAIGLYTLLGIIVFMVYKKFRLHQKNKKILMDSSLCPTSSSSSSPSHNSKHQVFPNFHGADVRKSLISHFMKAFKSKAIDIFIDNDIRRGMSIGPKLIEAIVGSRIAIVFLSRNYASSSWCLDELVEIMKCRQESSQTVIALFYEVNPTDVKKQTGDFGKVFKTTCKGKTEEVIGRWKHALAEVAKIAGYDSSNWSNDAEMIEEITNIVSNMLNISTPSSDFTGLVGMEAHMKELEPMLRLESDEVRMIGILGPSGIGKTTIARNLFSKLSESFELKVFMENVKGYTKPDCTDDHGFKLHLEKEFLSKIFNQDDIEVHHLGVAQDRLKDKKVLVVLDDVDKSTQLDAMAKDTQWFGPGSRIIITTQNNDRLLKARGITDIYKVNFPSTDEAFQIFCMNAFGQNSPKDGFEELAWDATYLAGIHPSGITGSGSYFRGMSKQEWTKEMSTQELTDALLRLRTDPYPNFPSISRIRKEMSCAKRKVLSRISSKIKKSQIEAANAAAKNVYERSVKDHDKKNNVESSGASVDFVNKH